MDGLLPAATLRAGPPSHAARASSVIAGLTWVLVMIPLCSYARIERLQGVAFARSMASTEGAAYFAARGSTVRWGRPAVLLSCWTLLAKPVDLLGAFPPDFVRKVPKVCIALVIPLSQQNRVLCNAWVLSLFCSPCFLSAVRAAGFFFADPGIGCLVPFMATRITAPTSNHSTLRHHAVRSAIVILIVPLSCHRGVFGSQGVVPTHFAAAALRASIAICPARNYGCPAVQVAIWALVTYPVDLCIAIWFDDNVAQICIGSMVPLLLQMWIKTANVWVSLLHSRMLGWL